MNILKNGLNNLEKKYFSNFSQFKKYFFNIFWMFSGKAYYILASGLMSVFIARYLKPTNFGVISYVLSLIAILSPLITLGLEQVVIKDLVKNKKNENLILGTSFYLKLFGGIIAFLILNLFNIFVNQDPNTKIITFILSFMLILKSFELINFYLQSCVKIKYFVFVESVVFTLILLLKILLILLKKGIYYFAAIYLLETFLISFGLIIIYLFILKKNIFEWQFSFDRAKGLLKRSYPLIISSVMVTIYMKIDQVIIKNMIGAAENGFYAVAVKLSEMWYFIPMSLVIATYPSLIGSFEKNKNKFKKRFRQLNFVLLIVNLLIAILTSLFAENIILFLYGSEYLPAVGVLKIYIWASIAVSLGLTASKWLVINGLQKYNMHSSSIGSITNIILNFILIPKWGINGSAWATLISYSLSGFFTYFFFRETRELFFLQVKSLTGISVKNT